jgi:Tfp pilus assembly protein PilN
VPPAVSGGMDVNMKNDINLLQKRKAKQYSGKKMATIFLFVALFAALLYAGIALPSRTLAAAQAKSRLLEEELTSQPAIEMELAEKTQYNAMLMDQVTGLKVLSDAKSDVSQYLAAVEASLPTSARISFLNLSGNMLNISGIVTKDEVLATFALRLRESQLFKDVFISSSVLTNEDNTTLFTITVTLPGSLSGSALVLDGSEEANADSGIEVIK